MVFFDILITKIDDFWEQHSIARIIMYGSPIILVTLFLKLNIQNTCLWYICIVPLLIVKTSDVLRIMVIIISYVYSITLWLYHNYTRIKATFFSVLTMCFALLLLACFSIFLATSFLEKWQQYIISVDIVNHSFVYELILLVSSITIMFILSLVFHFIYVKLRYDRWSYQITKTILTFLVGVAFTTLLGLSMTVGDYMDLYMKKLYPLYMTATGYDAELAKFGIKSMVTIVVYGAVGLILAYQVAFSIAYKTKRSQEENE